MFIDYGKYDYLLKRERQCRELYNHLTDMVDFEQYFNHTPEQMPYWERIMRIRKKAYKRWMYAAGITKTRQSFDEIKIG
jgi:hypothetical protein